jgi:hypothetical protein
MKHETIYTEVSPGGLVIATALPIGTKVKVVISETNHPAQEPNSPYESENK